MAAENLHRLQRLDLVATVPILRNGLDPTLGSGDVVVEYQGRHLTATVLLEPALVGRAEVLGYLAIASQEHQLAGATAAPSLQQTRGSQVRYTAKILGIVEVMANPRGRPFMSCLADCGQRLTLLLELSAVERLAFEDIVAGVGVVHLRRAHA